jgi:hypothetical protein
MFQIVGWLQPARNVGPAWCWDGRTRRQNDTCDLYVACAWAVS